MRYFVAVLVLASVLSAGRAGAAGARLLEDGWLLGPAWSGGSGDERNNGAFVWAAAGVGRLFGLPDLPLSALRLTVGRRRAGSTWSCTAGWQRLGRELLVVDHAEATVGRTGRWRCRLRAVAERQVLAGVVAPVRRRTEAVLGWGWRSATGFGGHCDIHLALVDEMVRDPRHVTPLIRLALDLAPASCAVAWDRRGDGTPLLGAEVTVELSRGAAVSWRYDGGSRSLGWGLVLRRGPLVVRSSHLVHPDLGTSHRWQLAAGGGPLPSAAGR